MGDAIARFIDTGTRVYPGIPGYTFLYPGSVQKKSFHVRMCLRMCLPMRRDVGRCNGIVRTFVLVLLLVLASQEDNMKKIFTGQDHISLSFDGGTSDVFGLHLIVTVVYCNLRKYCLPVYYKSCGGLVRKRVKSKVATRPLHTRAQSLRTAVILVLPSWLRYRSCSAYSKVRYR